MSSSSECLLPYYTAHNYRSMGVFNTSMGDLQRQLYKGGEYDIFKYAPMFESDFIQISKKGEVIDVHNRVRMVTVGIASTSPILPLPDVMLLARPAKMCEDHPPRVHTRPTKGRGRKSTKALELTRLLPLKFVKISIHDRQKQQLRLKLATGRTFYLQLCPPSDAREDLFCYWEKLVYLLRPPMESSSSTPTLQTGDMNIDDDKSLLIPDLQGEGDQQELKHHKTRDIRGISSSAYAGGEGIQPTITAGGPPPTTTATPTQNPEAASTSGSLAFAGATSKGAVSLVASSKVCQNNLAVTSVTSSGPGDLNTSQTISGSMALSTETTTLTMAGQSNKHTQVKSSRNKTKTRVATREPPKGDDGGRAPAAAPPPPLVSTLQSEGYMSERDGSQKTPMPVTEDRKEKREKRERREKKEKKERSPSRKSRSRPPRSREGHRRSGSSKPKRKRSSRRPPSRRPPSRRPSRKSSSHRSLSRRGSLKDINREKSPGSSRRRRGSRKAQHHRGSGKESGSSQKVSNSRSTIGSSDSLSKKPSKIGSFLRNLRAPVPSPSQRGVDFMAKTMEKRNLEAKVEQVVEGEGVDVSGIMTSETRETIIIETKSA